MATGSETLIIVGIGLYPLPTLIAAAREKTHGAAGVFLLNIFLGWTLIGWLVAFIWACSGRTTAEDHRAESRNTEVQGKQLPAPSIPRAGKQPPSCSGSRR